MKLFSRSTSPAFWDAAVLSRFLDRSLKAAQQHRTQKRWRDYESPTFTQRAQPTSNPLITSSNLL
jgi:hypothetical protein